MNAAYAPHIIARSIFLFNFSSFFFSCPGRLSLLPPCSRVHTAHLHTPPHTCVPTPLLGCLACVSSHLQGEKGNHEAESNPCFPTQPPSHSVITLLSLYMPEILGPFSNILCAAQQAWGGLKKKHSPLFFPFQGGQSTYFFVSSDSKLTDAVPFCSDK